MWPSAMPSLGIDVKGRIVPGELAEPGRSVARFTDLALGARVRATVAADGVVPPDVIAATVRVLAAWDWDDRPTSVVHVGSTSRPGLVLDLAAQLARIGRLTDLGGVAHHGGVPAARSNSAQRLRAIWAAYELAPSMADSVARGAPILLVDDYTESGWTIAVVARLLRRAGAGAVYPLVLGLAG